MIEAELERLAPMPELDGAAAAPAAAMPRAVLFDLDGTLIDSVPDITLAVAELLRVWFLASTKGSEMRTKLGEAPLTRTEIRALVDYSNASHWKLLGELRRFRAGGRRVCDEGTPARE